jgi:asparagine synthase (glutamine-hydrolysing)
MSFLVLFNSDRAPIEIETRGRIGIEKLNAAVLGKFRQTAFLWADVGSEASRGAAGTPIDLNGRIWIIGRVRLDGRELLCADLRASPSNCDKLLCLRSYAEWGEQSLEHLQGDFCFVIWDEDRQQLFCARDQLGVKPLFYGHAGNRWFVSDALESIRLNSTLGGELDDHWVADFLTTGFCLDVHRSVYKEISRVPPAHVLVASSGGSEVRRYWTLNIEAPIFYRKGREYLDRFHELMALSIRDRLPQGQVGVAMSGGLDSSTLAAKAAAVAGDASRVIADTCYFDHLVPDEEKHFSSLVASRLGIRLTLTPVDNACYDRLWETRDIQTPEPTTSITRAAPQQMIGAEMANQAQVWFHGEGPDNALTFEWRAYLRWLRDRRDWPRLGGAMIQYLCNKQAREWRTTFETCVSRRREDETGSSDAPPRWMDDAFVRKVDFAARVRDAGHAGLSTHPWRPRAIASFTSPIWPGFFDVFDAAASGVPIEWRHPYLDLRVLTFLLSVPPIPWARRKLLIREAMKGVLPGEVLSRKKAPLVDDPAVRMLQKYPLRTASLSAASREFVNEVEVPSRPGNARETHELIKIRALDFWLRSR